MKIAIGLPVAVPGTQGPEIVEWARRAEAAGFSSLGTIGRIVYPSHEELVALAAAAGATERIGLATTVMIGPVREPVLLAKQTATLDAISGGRFSLGLGVGWRDDDFTATGAEWKRRGATLDAQIDVMRRVWAGEPPQPGIDPVGPEPGRRGGPELILGGSAPPALARAGRLGDAFLAVPGAPDQVEEQYRQVLAAQREAGRPSAPRLLGAGYFALGDADRGRASMADYYAAGGPEFVAAMTGMLMTDAAAVRASVEDLGGIGVDEVFLWPATPDPDEVDRLAAIVL